MTRDDLPQAPSKVPLVVYLDEKLVAALAWWRATKRELRVNYCGPALDEEADAARRVARLLARAVKEGERG